MSSIRPFAGYSHQSEGSSSSWKMKGIIKTNPSQAILLRSTRRNAFTPEEALQIFRYLAKRQRSQSTTEVLRFFRDELILLLMVFHGLRQYQIPKLKLSSVQQSNGTIILNVRKGFGIKLEGFILNKLRMYLVMRNSNSESVFLEPFESKPITVSGLMAMLIELRYALTLDCTPKKLFNTYLYFQDNPEEKKRILDILTFESSRNTRRFAECVNFSFQCYCYYSCFLQASNSSRRSQHCQ